MMAFLVVVTGEAFTAALRKPQAVTLFAVPRCVLLKLLYFISCNENMLNSKYFGA